MLDKQGSILVYNAQNSTLKLYDELKVNNNSIIDFPSKDFSVDEGLAGLAILPKSVCRGCPWPAIGA